MSEEMKHISVQYKRTPGDRYVSIIEFPKFYECGSFQEHGKADLDSICGQEKFQKTQAVCLDLRNIAKLSSDILTAVAHVLKEADQLEEVQDRDVSVHGIKDARVYARFVQLLQDFIECHSTAEEFYSAVDAKGLKKTAYSH